MHRTLTLLATSLLLAGCTATPPGRVAQGPQCFRADSVTGFTDAGADKAIINIGNRESWELTLSPGCPGVDWAMQIGIRSRGGERVCEGRPAELFVPDASGHGARRCLVREVRRLSPSEARAVRGDAPRQ